MKDPAATVRETVLREEEGTRERMIREALRLLATRGFNGVSLRRIVQASGAANPSALHYHFGNRSTLIREIARWLQEWLEPRTCERLGRLGEKERASLSVREVLVALYGPVIDMLREPGLGVDAVRFIARLGWDFGREGQEVSAELHKRSQEMAFSLLHQLMPDLEEDVLKFRLVMVMNAVYNGIAYRSYLLRSPFGRVELPVLKLTEAFFDHLEAGVRGNPSTPVARPGGRRSSGSPPPSRARLRPDRAGSRKSVR